MRRFSLRKCFLSEFYSFSYELGKTYDTAFQTQAVNDCVDSGFHSFNTLKDVYRTLREYKDYFGVRNTERRFEFVIVKCVIPKYARYWDGDDAWNSNIKERCSDQIRIDSWRRINETGWKKQAEFDETKAENNAE